MDLNIPMYLVGSAHPNKVDAQSPIERCISDRELHRYAAIDRKDAIQPAFDTILGIVDEVFPVDASSVERAKSILLGSRRLSARDAIHVAVMEQQGVGRILSFDTGFEGYPGIARIAR